MTEKTIVMADGDSDDDTQQDKLDHCSHCLYSSKNSIHTQARIKPSGQKT